jgi:tetratricopeptide (TPR) repeat protein
LTERPSNSVPERIRRIVGHRDLKYYVGPIAHALVALPGTSPAHRSKEAGRRGDRLAAVLERTFPDELARRELLATLLESHECHGCIVSSEFRESPRLRVLRTKALFRTDQLVDVLRETEPAELMGLGDGAITEVHYFRASTLYRQGRHHEAYAVGRKQLLMAFRLKDAAMLQQSLVNLAGISFSRERHGRADMLYRAAILAASKQPHLPSQASATWGLADLADRRGEREEALSGYRAALSMHQSLGNVAWSALLNRNIAETLIDLGRMEEAAEPLRHAEQGFSNPPSDAGLMWVHYSYAKLELRLNKPARARVRLRRLASILEANHAALPEVMAVAALVADALNKASVAKLGLSLPVNLVGGRDSSEPKWSLAGRLARDKLSPAMVEDARRLVFGPDR